VLAHGLKEQPKRVGPDDEVEVLLTTKTLAGIETRYQNRYCDS